MIPLHEMIREQFRDKTNKIIIQLIMVAEVLQKHPRINLVEVAKDLEIPLSTMYERLRLLEERLIMRTAFEAIPWEESKAMIPCQKCKSKNTTELYSTVESGQVKISGITCNECNAKTIRGAITQIALRTRELELQEEAKHK